MKTTGVLLVVSVLAAAFHSATAAWSMQEAAGYLDARMDLWFTNATKLQTGSGKTACVSCHTPIPYALARPELRRMMGVSRPTAQELALADNATSRVQTLSTHELLYAYDDEKKSESRGTEAVLNALILLSANAPSGGKRPPGPVRQAVTELWESQRADGAWDWLDFGLEPFESAQSVYQGAALAALAVGWAAATPADQSTKEHVSRLHGYLTREYGAQNLYNQTWALLASSRMTGLLTMPQKSALASALAARQHPDGGWALRDLGPWQWSRTRPPYAAPGTVDESLAGQSDGYATGLTVYALRQSGTPAGNPVVTRGLQWLKANQLPIRVGEHEWRAWRAHSMNFDREHGGAKGEPWRRLFMSDAATAFAVLAISSER